MTLADEPRLSAFNPARVSFGRHETFPLRYAWAAEGVRGDEREPALLRVG